ncbi:MAG: PEP-CTERM sorting domain-containing protein [Phycisphaerae bacterium]|nr:PEP-CTERM sorting domain-containing protein [Tepidisphaeraceae bacterium]
MGIKRHGSRAIIPVFAGIVGLGMTGTAQAAVKLTFSPIAGTPAAVHVAPGGTFSVPLYLLNDAGEKVTGASVNFDIGAGPAAGDQFTFQSRLLNWTDTAGSHTSDFPEVVQASPPSGGTLPTSAAMPKNQNFYAGTATSGITGLPIELNNGIHPYAQFTFNVLGSAPKGTYTLTTYDDDTFSWTAGAPNYDDLPYSAVATISIVVPEPGAVGLLAATAVGVLAGRRRARRA